MSLRRSIVRFQLAWNWRFVNRSVNAPLDSSRCKCCLENFYEVSSFDSKQNECFLECLYASFFYVILPSVYSNACQYISNVLAYIQRNGNTLANSGKAILPHKLVNKRSRSSAFQTCLINIMHTSLTQENFTSTRLRAVCSSLWVLHYLREDMPVSSKRPSQCMSCMAEISLVAFS